MPLGLLYSLSRDIAGVLSDYFEIGELFEIWKVERRSGKRIYDRVEDYWRDSLDHYYFEGNRNSIPILTGSLIRLNRFKITEWVPWSPGRIWTSIGRQSIDRANKSILGRDLEELNGFHVFSPWEKNLMVLGGIGNVRLAQHGDNEYKILCATNKYADTGIPLVVKGSVYRKIEREIEENKTFRADITGRYLQIPTSLDPILEQCRGVSRHCIYVGSHKGIINISQSSNVSANAWSILGKKDNSEFNFAYATFDPSNESSIDNAAKFIEQYAKKHKYNLLTDFDEIRKRTNSCYPLKDVIAGRIGQLQLAELIKKIDYSIRNFR